MTEFAKDIFGKLETFLRAIAPGFVLLLALALAEGDSNGNVARLFSDKEWRGVGIGLVFGLLSYSMHHALLEDWLVLFVIREVRRLFPQDIPDALLTTTVAEIIPILSRERWARMVSKDEKTVALQAALSRGYSWFIFLYCSGYLLIVGALWLCIGDHSTSARGLLVAVVGVIFFLAAILADIKATRHEMFLTKNYPQFPGALPLMKKEPNQPAPAQRP